jgi:hypothetical protein
MVKKLRNAYMYSWSSRANQPQQLIEQGVVPRFVQPFVMIERGFLVKLS